MDKSVQKELRDAIRKLPLTKLRPGLGFDKFGNITVVLHAGNYFENWAEPKDRLTESEGAIQADIDLLEESLLTFADKYPEETFMVANEEEIIPFSI